MTFFPSLLKNNLRRIPSLRESESDLNCVVLRVRVRRGREGKMKIVARRQVKEGQEEGDSDDDVSFPPLTVVLSCRYLLFSFVKNEFVRHSDDHQEKRR